MFPQPRSVWYLAYFVRNAVGTWKYKVKDILLLHIACRDIRAQLLVKRRSTRNESQKRTNQFESVLGYEARTDRKNIQKPDQSAIGGYRRGIEGRTLS